MHAFFVVHLLDEGWQVFQDVEVRLVVGQVHFFLLQRLHEALDEGIVVRIALGGVGDGELVLVQQGDVIFAQVRHAAIRVVHAARGRPALLDRLFERREGERRIDVPGDCPTDRFAREQIEDDREIHEAVHDPDVRQVRGPGLVDAGQAFPRQEVRIHPVRMVRVGGVDEGAFDLGVE